MSEPNIVREYRTICESLRRQLAEAQKAAGVEKTEAERLREENTRLRDDLAQLQVAAAECLTNVAQVFDGWHQDGTAWTEWDEAVRSSVSRILRALAEGGGQ